MVLMSTTLLARARGGDRYWKRRRVFSLTAHYFGRRKNCYTIAIQQMHRSLKYSTHSRKLKKRNYIELWEERLDAGCKEIGTNFTDMKTTLRETGVAVDRKALNYLAIWEPRSFRSLALLTKAKQAEMGFNSLEGPMPAGVITRGML